MGYLFYKNGVKWKLNVQESKQTLEKQLDAVLVIKTNTCSTSLRLHWLPLTFTLSLQLKMLIKANYNQQMCVSSCGTDYSAIRLFVLGLAIMKKLLGIVVKLPYALNQAL